MPIVRPMPALPPQPASWVCRAAILLSIAGGVLPVTAHADVQQWVCPMLLMDFECAQYHQRLQQSTSEEERCGIEREYRLLLEERQHACRCSDTPEMQEARLSASLPP